ncbi:MAG: hypothetical protein JNN11_05555 [Candidatus Doudnabacteria bacterium]|nr:hypothetical protein [Candidatus Doudnabacteria bacterium]
MTKAGLASGGCRDPAGGRQARSGISISGRAGRGETGEKTAWQSGQSTLPSALLLFWWNSEVAKRD